MTNNYNTLLQKHTALTSEQISIIVGSLLGDAKLEFGKTKARFIYELTIKHKDFLYDMADIFDNWVHVIKNYNHFDKRTSLSTSSIYMSTITSEEFLVFAKLFYKHVLKTRINWSKYYL